MIDLNAGDFLYQSDQELLLVVTGETEDTYNFAVHGWRNIDKERIEEYVEDSRSKVHQQDEVEEIVNEKGDEQTQENFNQLKQLFNVYKRAELPDDGIQNEFAFEEE
jgi:hypothetical protein